LLSEPKGEEVEHEKNSDPEGVYYRFHRRVCPEGMLSIIDSIEEFVRRECLRIMFPECNIEIRLAPAFNSQNEEIPIRPDQNQIE
jgi:hypothetical protein